MAARLLAALTVAGVIGGCSAAPPSETLADGTVRAASLERGKQLYDTHGCANCHGREGRGNGHLAPTLDPPPRDFRDRAAYRQGTSPEDIARTLSTGIVDRRTAMPPYAHLPASDRLSIGLFVASLQATEPSRP
jgi:high-affinity iron transporter